jgi:acyl-CoA reductase-like NAD-dependent aldehyde dehydrogenase
MDDYVATAVVAGEVEQDALQTPGPSKNATVPLPPLTAPPPDTVVAADWRRLFAAEEKARAMEAAIRSEHRAEVARLTQALQDARLAHQAEIDRCRAQHATDVRRLVEALWQAQDMARAALDRRDRGEEAKEPSSLPVLRPRPLGVLLALMRRGGRCTKQALQVRPPPTGFR